MLNVQCTSEKRVARNKENQFTLAIVSTGTPAGGTIKFYPVSKLARCLTGNKENIYRLTPGSNFWRFSVQIKGPVLLLKGRRQFNKYYEKGYYGKFFLIRWKSRKGKEATIFVFYILSLYMYSVYHCPCPLAPPPAIFWSIHLLPKNKKISSLTSCWLVKLTNINGNFKRQKIFLFCY